MARFGCPHCGSEEIGEANEAFTWLRVFAWDVDCDEPVPIEFDRASAEWETADNPPAPYKCLACDETLTHTDLVRLDPDEPEDAAERPSIPPLREFPFEVER